MVSTIIFESKEKCLEYYRKVYPDKTDEDINWISGLFEKYPQWFERPQISEEDRKEIDDFQIKLEEYLSRRRTQNQKSLVA